MDPNHSSPDATGFPVTQIGKKANEYEFLTKYLEDYRTHLIDLSGVSLKHVLEDGGEESDSAHWQDIALPRRQEAIKIKKKHERILNELRKQVGNGVMSLFKVQHELDTVTSTVHCRTDTKDGRASVTFESPYILLSKCLNMLEEDALVPLHDVYEVHFLATRKLFLDVS